MFPETCAWSAISIWRLLEVRITNLLCLMLALCLVQCLPQLYCLDCSPSLRKFFLMTRSYSPKNYLDFDVCFFPLFVCFSTLFLPLTSLCLTVSHFWSCWALFLTSFCFQLLILFVQNIFAKAIFITCYFSYVCYCCCEIPGC